MSNRRMTMSELLSLPPSVSVQTAADALGIHRTTLYDLIARNESPVTVLRLGRKIRLSTTSLWAYLGVPAPFGGDTSGQAGEKAS